MSDEGKEIWERMLSLIEQNGWCIQVVGAGQQSPLYTYTIGLSDKDLPELIITGLHPNVAGQFLNGTAERLISGEYKGLDEEMLGGLALVPLKLRELDFQDVEKAMLASIRYAKGKNKKPRFMQIMFPDEKGAFPGDPSCDAQYSKMQSLAGLK